MAAFEETITRTSTEWAPWWVIPADHKWVSRALVAAILSRAMKRLGLQRPELSPREKAQLTRARKQLMGKP
jgi:hypothetical protein